MKASKTGLSAVLPALTLAVAWATQVASAQTFEPPAVSLAATDYHAAEGGTDFGAFTLSRTGSTEGSLLVFLQWSGTASNGLDYQELPNTITIPAGSATAIIAVKPIDDSLVEGTETVIATVVPSPVLSPIEPYRVGFPASDILLLGDNDFPAGGASEPVVLVAPGSIWKYLDDGSDPGTDWRGPDFDDTAWKSGPGQLGFGDGDEATLLSPGNNDRRFVTYYFRRSFELVDAGNVIDLTARVVRDDGAVVYLNGVEAWRSNMPDGPVNAGTLATVVLGPEIENLPQEAPLNPWLLANGRNVVAVEVHQANALSSDVSFDLGLTARTGTITNSPLAVSIYSPTNGAVFAGPATIRLLAHVTPITGAAAVEFFAGTNSLGQATFYPTKCSICPLWILTWSNVVAGDYILRAQATGADGAMALSDPVRVRVEGLALPVVNITATDPEGAETNPASDVPPNPAVFRVTRSGDRTKALTVYYKLSGTAVNGVDYAPLPGVVTIAEGAEAAEIVVEPIDDSLEEGTESVVASLVPLSGIDPPAGTDAYVVGDHARAEAHILDNDILPPNALPLVKLVRPENGSIFSAPALVLVQAEAVDPDGWVGLVEFFANDRKIGEQQIVFIRAPDPGQLQAFSFEWHDAPAGDYVLTARATDDRGGRAWSEPRKISVRAPDGTLTPTVTVIALDPYAREGLDSAGQSNPAVFVVRRDGPTNALLTVFYSMHGTAENGKDYDTLPGTVTIPAGRHTARVVVRPLEDTLREDPETVELKLEPDPTLGMVPRYRVGWPGSAAAILVDAAEPAPTPLHLPGGWFHVCLPGTNGAGFRVEYSTDLQTWTPLGAGVVTDGAIHFVDPDAAWHERRFYRALPAVNTFADD